MKNESNVRQKKMKFLMQKNAEEEREVRKRVWCSVVEEDESGTKTKVERKLGL